MSFYDPTYSYRDSAPQQRDDRPSFFSIDNRPGYDSTPWHGAQDNPAFALRAAQRAAQTQAMAPMQESEPPPDMATLLTNQFGRVAPERFADFATGAGTSGNEDKLLAHPQFQMLPPAQRAAVFKQSQGHSLEDYGQLKRAAAMRDKEWNNKSTALKAQVPLVPGGGDNVFSRMNAADYAARAAALTQSRPRELSYADMHRNAAEDKFDGEHLDNVVKWIGTHPVNWDYDHKTEMATIPAVMAADPNDPSGQPVVKIPARKVKITRGSFDEVARMSTRQGIEIKTTAEREKEEAQRADHAQLEAQQKTEAARAAARTQSPQPQPGAAPSAAQNSQYPRAMQDAVWAADKVRNAGVRTINAGIGGINLLHSASGAVDRYFTDSNMPNISVPYLSLNAPQDNETGRILAARRARFGQ